MTTIKDGNNETVARFTHTETHERDAVVCIGPMARALGVTLFIDPAPKAIGADLPRNVTLESAHNARQSKLVAKP